MGTAAAPDRPRVDNAMVKTLARAFRSCKLLATRAYGMTEVNALASERR
jgi:hypothetical protein